MHNIWAGILYLSKEFVNYLRAYVSLGYIDPWREPKGSQIWGRERVVSRKLRNISDNERMRKLFHRSLKLPLHFVFYFDQS